MPFQPASDILTPYTVLDLTRVRAGPTCARQLADWGANVIKIEQPTKDTSGADGMGGPRAGSDFQNLHRNKRGMTLNLKDPEGQAIFKLMATKADVIVENYRPGVKHRLGIDYETLRADNPGLIYASISGFGQDGPLAERPGFDQILQGMGGLMSITGEPGRGPMRVGIPIADLCAGLLASQGIMLALLKRERTGEGQWVQSSLLQAQAFMLDFQAARWLMDGEVAGQAGNDHPTSIPTGVFKTSDGYINIAASGGTMWERLRDHMNDERLKAQEFASAEGRSDHREKLNAILNENTERQTSAHWVEALNGVGVPCGEINTIDKTFESPQMKHLNMAWDVDSHERGKSKLVGQPIVMSGSAAAIVAPPPTIGEHTREVLGEYGYDTDEIEQFAANGVI